jgi:ABC-type phosphate transport system substrate-binding protein
MRRAPFAPVVAWFLGLLALAAAGVVPTCPATAQTKGGVPVKVVANGEGAEARITREDLARIFLGKKTLWESGARVVPCMVEEGTPAGEAFLDETLHKTVSQYRAFWKRLLFSGGGAPPRTFHTSAQVLDFVARQPGAIGVVEASAADDRVKVVQVTD